MAPVAGSGLTLAAGTQQEEQEVSLCPLPFAILNTIQTSYATSVAQQGRHRWPCACLLWSAWGVVFCGQRGYKQRLGLSPASGEGSNLVPTECRFRWRSE
jgi:hypothetical protein